MEPSEFPPMTISVFGREVTSEIVKIEESDNDITTFHIKSSCVSTAWGIRSQMYMMGVPNNYEHLAAHLNATRKTAAELVIKEELGTALPKAQFLVMEVQTPDCKRWLKAAATIDVRFGPSRFGKDYLDVWGFKPLGSKIAEIRSDGALNSLPLYSVVMRFGEHEVQTLAVPYEGGLPCIVGGDFVQQASRTELLFELLGPEHWRALRNVARCKKKVVLIIGKYGEHRSRLEQIEKLLAEKGYQGVVLDNFPDIEEQSLPEKMVLFASIARFIVCLDEAPSGHIDELRICSDMQFTTAILRPHGMPSTAMQANLALSVDHMQVFDVKEYAFEQAVIAALEWAEKKVLERSAAFNRLYGWRSPDKILG